MPTPSPAWASELVLAYESRASNQFILFGNVHDRVAVNDRLVGLADYLWQFYLPRPWFVEDLATLPPRAAYETWVVGSWGAFAWGEVRFPPVVYGLVAASGAIVARHELRWSER